MSVTTSTSSAEVSSKTTRGAHEPQGRPSRAPAKPRPSDRARQAKAAVALLLRDAPEAEVERVLATTHHGDEQSLDAALWGPKPSSEQATAGVLANLRKQFAGRRTLEDESVSRAEAAALLGISDQAVTGALEAKRILGFKRGRRWLLPAWQFDPEAERGMLPALGELAAVFPGGVVSLSAWATRPHPDHAGGTPRDALAKGKADAVLRSARMVTAAGW